jgi:hypothetical protein
MQQQRLRARARLASAEARLAREFDSDLKAEVEDLRREYRFTAAEEYVNTLLRDFPTLTQSQLDRLVGLLRGTAAPRG